MLFSTPILVLALVTLTNLVLAIFVYSKNRKSLVNISYSLFVFSVSMWAFTNALFQKSDSLNSAYWWAILSYISAIFIGSSLLTFSFVFSENDQDIIKRFKGFYGLIILIITVLITVFVSTPQVVLKRIAFENGVKSLITTPLLFLYAISIVLLLGWSLINIFKKYRKSSGISRQQLKLIFIGLFISIALGVFFNLFLPLLGFYNFVWLGPDSAIIMVIFFAYAVIKYRLFDLQIQFQKILNYLFPLIPLLPLSIFAGYYFHQTVHESPYVFGPIILILGCFLYKFIFEYISKTPIGYFFFRKTYFYQKTLKELTVDASTILDLDKLADRIVEVLSKNVGIRKVIIVTNVSGAKNFSVLRSSKRLEKSDIENFQSLPLELLIYLKKNNDTLIKEELELLIETVDNKKKKTFTDLIAEMKKLRVELCLPLLLQESLVGIIFLGPKDQKKAYSIEDIEIFKKLAKELAIAIANSTLHQTKAKQAELLGKEVEKQTKEIKELYDMKSNFLTVASHQLRTPTSIIRGMLSMLVEDPLKPDKQKEMLEASFKSSTNLERIVEDILTAAEIDSSKFGFKPEKVDLIPLARKVAEDLKLKAEKKKLYLKFVEPTFKKALAATKEAKIEQVFANLIDNALNYTKEGGVTISFSREKRNGKDCYIFSCQDTGIGITKKDLENIGEKFFRSKNVFSVHPNGTGLGIFIVKSILESSNGKLEIESLGLGQGSSFKVILPAVA